MSKFNFVWKIDKISDYQRGILPDNARKLKAPETIGEMTLKAVPFLIPLIIIVCGSMFGKVFLDNDFFLKPIFMILGLLSGFVLLLVHEILHGAVYPKDAKVTIGIMPKSFAAVALCSYPLSRKRFVIMSLLPFVLGIAPLVLFWTIPGKFAELNSFLFGISIMGITSPYMDCYNVYLVMKHTNKNSMIQFFEDNLYYFQN